MWSYSCTYDLYWDQDANKCLRCDKRFNITAGHEFSPNCGLSDDGSHHEHPYKRCPSGTFNNGLFLVCQKCSSACKTGYLLSECTATSDRCCCEPEQPVQNCRDASASLFTTCQVRANSTESPDTTSTTSVTTKTKASSTATEYNIVNHESTLIYTSHAASTAPRVTVQNPTNFIHSNAVTVAVLITFILSCALFFLLYIIRKKKPSGCRGMKRRVSRIHSNTHQPLEQSKENSVEDLRSYLSSEIQTAPLQTVLNNLDVVEELVVLLDPETPGMKNTRHLAASCSLPFTWINYTYSMKDSRSPLIALLEKVIAKHPCWSVGHLVDLLSKIGRNDAVAALAKLSVTTEEV